MDNETQLQIPLASQEVCADSVSRRWNVDRTLRDEEAGALDGSTVDSCQAGSKD